MNRLLYKATQCIRYPSIPYWYSRWLLSRWVPSLVEVECYSRLSVLREWHNFSQYYSFRHSIPDSEKTILETLSSGALAGSTVIDVGANIGLFTLGLADIFRQSSIISFEPSPATFEVLRRHVDASPFAGRVSLHCKAASSCDGTTTFVDDQSSSATNRLLAPGESLTTESDHNVYEVPTVSIDSFCCAHNIDAVELLKVDVEGFEVQVLEGAKEMIAQNRVKHIFLELCPANLSAVGSTAAQLWLKVQSLGLSAFRIASDSSLHLVGLDYFESAELENIILAKRSPE